VGTTVCEIYRSPVYILEGYWAHLVKYSDGTKRTILEHREVMEQHIGRRLLSTEYVHHIDGDKTNNAITNLQITTAKAHATHHTNDYEAEVAAYTCPECGATILKLVRMVRHNQGTYGKRGPFCDKSCSGKYTRRIQIANSINVLPKF
jgi:predicted RNA-binding Zn-ribbon protein involved in translation (DUF1610 family)